NNSQFNDALLIIEKQFNNNSNFDANDYHWYGLILKQCKLYNKSKEMYNKAIILSNYKDRIILSNYLQLIYEHFGDINEINKILNYSLKLNNHNYIDYLKYSMCYMILKNYKESQIMFEHSIQLNNKNLITYSYYGLML